MDSLDLDVVRALPAPPAVRANDDNGDGTVMTGHFSVFNEWYEIDSWFEGRFLERVAPGAFAETMAADRGNIKVTFNHGHDVLGDQVLGPIKDLREDKTGAWYEVPLFDGVPDLIADGLRAGVYGSSFRFRVTADSWDDEPGVSGHNPDGLPERTITRVRLFEFGPVTYPANPAATASARSLTDQFYERLGGEQYAAAKAKVSTGRPGTRSAGGGGTDTEEDPEVSPPTSTQPAAARNKENPVTDTDNATFTLTPEERSARLSEIRERFAEIDGQYPGGELPAEVDDEWNALEAEETQHERALAAVAKRREKLARYAESDGNTERAGDTGRYGNGGPAVIGGRSVSDIYDLGEIRKQARSVDELGDLYRDNARRAVEQARFPGVARREEAQAQAERLLTTVDDETGTLARRILVTGSPVYQRAFGKAAASLSTAGLTAEEQRALSLGTDSAGGYAVPFQLDPTVILTSDGSINPLRSISRVEQIVGKEWQGITSAGITVTRHSEAAQADDDAPSFAPPTVRPTRVQGFVPFSIEIDQDWAQLRAEMTTLLADAKEQEEAQSFAHGDGTGNNPAGVVATLDAGSHVDTAGVGAFVVDDIYALKNALPPRFRSRARWVADTAIYDEVRQFDEAGGSSLWVQLQDGNPPNLVGYPAHELTTMDSDSSEEEAEILLFGDFSQFLIVDRVGMSVELVPHLFGANGRPTGQRGLYAIWRNSSLILTDNAFRLLVVQAT